jgi:EAL domain-containing protein (putative c-di-GMP-specific phosphodiesterase class I)
VQDTGLAGCGLAQEVRDAGLEPAEVVIEVAERVAALDRQAFRAAVRALKGQGFPIAIDDMGAGYSSLGVVAEMEPDFLKFDVSLVRNLDTNPIKRSLLETVVHVSEKVQAPVVACGIETTAELSVIRELRVPMGEGRILAPPVAFAPPGDR